jgi:antitoxin PrlF
MQTSDDLAVGAFLRFLEKDIVEHPGRLQPITVEMVNEWFALVEGVEVNLDEPLSDDDDE